MQLNENLIEIKSEIYKKYLETKKVPPVNIIGDINIYHISDLLKIIHNIKNLPSDYARKQYLLDDITLFENIQKMYE